MARLLNLIRKLFAAAPDLALAGAYLWCWIDPLAWRRTLVAELMLVMLIEFLVVHSGPFLGILVMGDDVAKSRATRLKILAGLGAVYLLFAGGMAAAFKSWWPVLLFVWLIGAKLLVILFGRGPGVPEQVRQMGLWGFSVVFYLGAVFATLFIPMPEFGVTQHGRDYGVPGSGLWVDQPNRVIAAGLLYFGALGIVKLLENPDWWKKLDEAQSGKSSSSASR